MAKPFTEGPERAGEGADGWATIGREGEAPVAIWSSISTKTRRIYLLEKKKKKHQRQNKEHVNVEYLNF